MRFNGLIYVIYVIGGYYIANGVNGPWTDGQFEFLNCDRRLIEGNFAVIDVEKKFDKDVAYDLGVIINPLDKKPVI